jgi:hypothetical protein
MGAGLLVTAPAARVVAADPLGAALLGLRPAAWRPALSMDARSLRVARLVVKACLTRHGGELIDLGVAGLNQVLRKGFDMRLSRLGLVRRVLLSYGLSAVCFATALLRSTLLLPRRRLHCDSVSTCMQIFRCMFRKVQFNLGIS